MIQLRFNNCCTRERCAITGEDFKPDVPLAFFLDGDFGKPVLPEVALKEGFTMLPEDFKSMTRRVWLGIAHGPNEAELDAADNSALF